MTIRQRRQRRQRKALLNNIFLGVCATFTICLTGSFLAFALAHTFSIHNQPTEGHHTMTLTPVSLFHTPADMDELQSWIERHSPEDRAHLYTAAMMAWNLAAKLTATPEVTE